MKPMKIGEAARVAGVEVDTIRFYEREGLLEPPPRRESGYRAYDERVIHRIRFVKRAKNLGFSLKEIRELLSLRLDPRSNCREVKRRSEAKLADIEEKLDALQGMRRALLRLVVACRGRRTTSECPILDALESRHAGARRNDRG